MEFRGRRWLSSIAGLVAIGTLLAPARTTAAQQQSADKKPAPGSSRSYDPGSLRGIRTYLRTAPNGPGASTLFPTLPPSAERPVAGELSSVTGPRPSAAAGAVRNGAVRIGAVETGALETGALETGALEMGALAGPRAIETLAHGRMSTSDPEAAAPSAAVPARGAMVGAATPQDHRGSIVLTVGGLRRGGASISTPVSWRRRGVGRRGTAIDPGFAGDNVAMSTRVGRAPAQSRTGSAAIDEHGARRGEPANIVLTSTAGRATATPVRTSVAASFDDSARRPRYAAVVSSGGYRLGPGDTVDVFVWRNPELSRQVPVRPDGRISLPLAGELVAAGKTAGELQEEITAILAQYVQVPTITVTVTEIKSLVVYVLGSVAKPGPLELDRNVDVLQAIAMAGGLTEFADRNGVTIIRTVNGVEQRISFPYGDVVKGKVPVPRTMLQAGDVVYVP